MDFIARYVEAFWGVLAEAGWWLILGFAAAGLIHVFLPQRLVERHLSGRGFRSVLKAALIGAPIPMCSCSVIPTAAALRRRGVSKGSCASFAVASPEVDAPAVTLTWGLLGPFLAVARPIAAIVTATVTGLLVEAVARDQVAPDSAARTCCCASKARPSGGEAGGEAPVTPRASFVDRFAEAVTYGFVTLPRTLSVWLVVGLGIAAGVSTLVEPGALAEVGSGPLAIAAALVIGLPMYVCSASSTPMAAALVAAGVSPGAALVFLLAGPATNPATIAWAWRDLGARGAVAYVAGIASVAVASGLLVDWIVGAGLATVTASVAAPIHESGAANLSAAALAMLLGVGLIGRLWPTTLPMSWMKRARQES